MTVDSFSTSKNPPAPRHDLYREVSERIVSELEQGTAPWVKPWNSCTITGMPRNYLTNRPYSGINVLVLWLTSMERGYSDTRWLTANQIKELGGSFRGQKATRIVYTKSYLKDKDTTEEQEIRFLKVYNVFSVEQVSGIDFPPEAPPKSFDEAIPTIEAFIAAQDANLTHGGNRAFYSLHHDTIILPYPGDFQDAGSYYATLLHEHAHSTAHPSRLNRDLKGRFGSERYAAEELIAELASAYLCAFLGVPGKLQHASYLAHWVRLLQKDSRAIFTTASAASRAADYLRENAAAKGVQPTVAMT